MKVCLYRKAHFSAAHQLYCKAWTKEENETVFGKCANPHFHGHNYELTVGVKGEVDSESGYVMSLDTLKGYIREEVLDVLDHKNLNLEIPEFKDTNPTVENISTFIFNKLRQRIPKDKDLKVILYETPRNFAEISEF